MTIFLQHENMCWSSSGNELEGHLDWIPCVVSPLFDSWILWPGLAPSKVFPFLHFYACNCLF